MLQFTISNYQFAMNDQLAIINENSAALLLPSMKIENCEMKIAISEGVA